MLVYLVLEEAEDVIDTQDTDLGSPDLCIIVVIRLLRTPLHTS